MVNFIFVCQFRPLAKRHINYSNIVSTKCLPKKIMKFQHANLSRHVNLSEDEVGRLRMKIYYKEGDF